MFTGLSPRESGKVDSNWMPGEATIKHETIFYDAKANGFKTGYFFSKKKLGYLVNRARDEHAVSQDRAIYSSEAFIKSVHRPVHFMGLENIGLRPGPVLHDRRGHHTCRHRGYHVLAAGMSLHQLLRLR